MSCEAAGQLPEELLPPLLLSLCLSRSLAPSPWVPALIEALPEFLNLFFRVGEHSIQVWRGVLFTRGWDIFSPLSKKEQGKRRGAKLLVLQKAVGLRSGQQVIGPQAGSELVERPKAILL